jgi:hypothetical protein
MKARFVLLFAALMAVGGCAIHDRDAGSASPIVTTQQDCVGDGYFWNAKLGVCEVSRPR